MEESWPPKSPHAALLSSPSGRRKFHDHQLLRNGLASPLKRSTTMPNIQHSSREPPEFNEDVASDGSDEDEETLQLKLAAIEAKLKLKKLQQNKSKSLANISDVENNAAGEATPASPSGFSSKLQGKCAVGTSRFVQNDDVEVPLSPAKKPRLESEQRSPGRVLLGIDKGFRGSDISLRRARSAREGTGNRGGASAQRPASRCSSIRTARYANSETPGHIQSFSKRMAESRQLDRSKEDRMECVARRRATGFKLNKDEMESFRVTADEAKAHNPPKSPIRSHKEVTYRREDILRPRDRDSHSSGTSKRTRTLPDMTNPTDETTNLQCQGNSSLFEPFSQVNLSSRVLPNSFLQRTLPYDTYAFLRIPQLLKMVHSPTYELPDSIIDFVVFGIIASKSSPQNHTPGAGGSNSAHTAKSTTDWEEKWEDGSQNQKKFIVLQLTDLTWTVDLYLFGTAVPRYHRLSPGTLVAILNPGIMPPKKGKEDTGAFGLTLHSGDDTVLEIGTAQDLGFCKAVKKDGKECSSWVNSAKTEYCEWHLNAQMSKTQAGRMGVNSGSNSSTFSGRGSGSRPRNRIAYSHDGGDSEGHGLLPAPGEKRFDVFTGSHYFISPGVNPIASRRGGASHYQADRSAADHFIAGGQPSRDKDSQLRRRLAAQEKEREIARSLSTIGSGGAGREYMRHISDFETPSRDSPGSQNSTFAKKKGILNSSSTANRNGKRVADNVRLSPMKKTRLLTEKGIRHPGRESLGLQHGQRPADEDDDLEFV